VRLVERSPPPERPSPAVIVVESSALLSRAVWSPSTFAITWLWLSSATVAVMLTLPVPSNEAEVPETSPVREIVRPVSKAVAVAALPEVS